MSRLDVLQSNLGALEKNISIYDKEIETLTEKINDVVTKLKEDNVDYADNVFNTILSNGKSNLASFENSLLSLKSMDVGDEIIDYSVKSSDLSLKKTISINGKQVGIYTSKKTDALYVISNGLSQKERKQLQSELKYHLSNDQMAILTFNGDCYQYDIKNKARCTRDYAVVGKTDKGKMYSFEMEKDSEIVVDDGGANHTAMTLLNGMVIANFMTQTMETNAKVDLQARIKQNIDGGQKVTAFTRMVFSGGTHLSTGSEYASVYMDGDYLKYAYNGPDMYDSTKVYDNPGKEHQVDSKYTERYVTVGNGPSAGSTYTGTKHSVGTIPYAIIPFSVESGSQVGTQRMQATLCYFYEGVRSKVHNNTHGAKDMLKHRQRVVADWSNL